MNGKQYTQITELMHREFDQVRDLMKEHHVTLVEHINFDNAREERIVNELSKNNIVLSKAFSRYDAIIYYTKWLLSGVAGIIIAVLAYFKN